MFEELEKAIADLRNPRAGWVTRRDAAQALGQFAHHALYTLKEFRNEPDVDVRKAVRNALEQVKRPPDGRPQAAVPGESPRPADTLSDLVRACDKPNVRTVRPHDSGFEIEVRIDRERSQTVYVTPQEEEGGRRIRVFTYCAAAESKTSAWALQANVKLAECAFGMWREGDEDRLVLIRNLAWENATPEGLKAIVKQVAFYGDWFEKKASGKDEF